MKVISYHLLVLKVKPLANPPFYENRRRATIMPLKKMRFHATVVLFLRKKIKMRSKRTWKKCMHSWIVTLIYQELRWQKEKKKSSVSQQLYQRCHRCLHLCQHHCGHRHKQPCQHRCRQCMSHSMDVRRNNLWNDNYFVSVRHNLFMILKNIFVFSMIVKATRSKFRLFFSLLVLFSTAKIYQIEYRTRKILKRSIDE